jgi:hypothetical protein
MSKVVKKPDPWDQSVPTISDSALETVDGKDPGVYKRYTTNGPLVSRELTVEIGAAMAALSISLLTRMIRAIKLPNVQNGNNKISIIEALQDTVIRSGVKELVARMSRATMKKLSLLFSLQNTKQRNIVDCILRIGLPTFLHEKCDVPLFVDFCSSLGLEAGKPYQSSLLDHSIAQTDPIPPYIIHHDPSHEVEEDEETNGGNISNHTPSASHYQRFFPKPSAELERELADEIMLLGTEDLLKSLTVPVLHDMCVELGLLRPTAPPASSSASPAPLHPSLANSTSNDPYHLINLVMDHIFDLVPLDEYSRVHFAQPSLTTSSSSPTLPPTATSQQSPPSSQQIPSSPFLNATENSKKRKRDETGNSTTSTTSSSALANASPTATHAKPPLASPSAPKKAKYVEVSGDESAPPAAGTSTPLNTKKSVPQNESAMEVDTIPTPKDAEAKKARGARPGATAKTPVPLVAAKEPLASASPQSSHGGSSNSTKPGKRGIVSPSVKQASEPIVKPTEDQGVVNSASEDDRASPKRRPARMSAQTHKSKVMASAARSSKTSPPYDDDYSDESSEESSSNSEGDSRPTSSTGKGRSKYQAPPLSNIKKGVTGQDLHNLYNVTDLQDWCKQNRVDHTGKKSAVIKRILYSLDPANTKPPPPKKSRKFSSR